MATAAGLPSPADLAAAGRRELAALASLLAVAEPGHSVHGARRRIKQLRSLLRLLREGLGEHSFKATNDALREAADALAGQRRAEALVAAAAKLEGEAGVWSRLAMAHREAHARDGDPAAALVRARAAIDRAGTLIATAAPSHVGADSVAEAFIASYGRARRRLRIGLASRDAAELHAARKDVIHHLHHTALLTPERRKRLAVLEALREVLGDLNDLDELEQLGHGHDIDQAASRVLRSARRGLLRKAKKPAKALFHHGRRHVAKRLEKRPGHAAGHVPAEPGLG